MNPVVIMVEDDEGVQRAIARLLRLAGFEPRPYGSAESLLGEAAAVGSAACLLVDVQLPGLSGLALVEKLAEGAALPPVAFITASDDPSLRAHALRLGGAFLGKPFSAVQLLETVRGLTRAAAIRG
jgi:FixJ family two-component response regulator